MTNPTQIIWKTFSNLNPKIFVHFCAANPENSTICAAICRLLYRMSNLQNFNLSYFALFIVSKIVGQQPTKWSGRQDSNLRPPVPKTGALPGCATPRLAFVLNKQDTFGKTLFE